MSQIFNFVSPRDMLTLNFFIFEHLTNGAERLDGILDEVLDSAFDVFVGILLH